MPFLDSDFIQAAAAAVGALIAVALLLLERAQRTDSWLRTFRDHHELFWSDEDMATVRSWIACDQAYGELEAVLSKRLTDPRSISAEEYLSLETLDRFFNFLLRARLAYQRGSRSQRLWDQLYLQYWLDEIESRNRKALVQYVDMGYPDSKAVLYGETGRRRGVLGPLTRLLHRARSSRR